MGLAGAIRTFRVFFDLLTIRFLLRYMNRPLHFFGKLGALSILFGSILAAIVFGMKLLNPQLAVMGYHGPIVVVGSILIVCGIQLLALGLLSELQVRHYYTHQSQFTYTVDRVISLAPTDLQRK